MSRTVGFGKHLCSNPAASENAALFPDISQRRNTMLSTSCSSSLKGRMRVVDFCTVAK